MSRRPVALSFGGGVQSTTLLLMVKLGMIHADIAVFADPGWEYHDTYQHLWEVAQWSPIPIIIVSSGNIREDVLRGERVASMPIFLDSGEITWSPSKGWAPAKGFARRQCTYEYKLRPIYDYLDRWRDGQEIDVLVGISWDESQRVKPAPKDWAHRVDPLVDRRMRRSDCEALLAEHSITATRSSCVGCPMHSDYEWSKLSSREASESREVELALQQQDAWRGVPHLHSLCDPIDATIKRLQASEASKLSLFGADCDGACGT